MTGDGGGDPVSHPALGVLAVQCDDDVVDARVRGALVPGAVAQPEDPRRPVRRGGGPDEDALAGAQAVADFQIRGDDEGRGVIVVAAAGPAAVRGVRGGAGVRRWEQLRNIEAYARCAAPPVEAAPGLRALIARRRLARTTARGGVCALGRAGAKAALAGRAGAVDAASRVGALVAGRGCAGAAGTLRSTDTKALLAGSASAADAAARVGAL